MIDLMIIEMLLFIIDEPQIKICQTHINKKSPPKQKASVGESGRQDSNLRPPGPKPGAITGLRYAPLNRGAKIRVQKFMAKRIIAFQIPQIGNDNNSTIAGAAVYLKTFAVVSLYL